LALAEGLFVILKYFAKKEGFLREFAVIIIWYKFD